MTRGSLGESSIKDMHTWVDAAYSVQNDMGIRTVGTMQLGWATLHCKLTKQKLNTKGSMEAELVGLIEYLP